MEPAHVAGQHKRSRSWLMTWDRQLTARLVTRVPDWLHSWQLTMLTLLWSALVLTCSAMAVRNRSWMSVVSLIVVLQYLTDAVDGKLGVARGEGLVRWGFYMDHLLDYVFLSSMLLGYALLVPPPLQVAMLAIFGLSVGFMVSSFLACAVEGNLGISYLRLGPVEIRLLFIAINVWLAAGGRAPLSVMLPIITIALAFALAAMVFQTQARLWRADTSDVIHHSNHAARAPQRPVFPEPGRAPEVVS